MTTPETPDAPVRGPLGQLVDYIAHNKPVLLQEPASAAALNRPTSALGDPHMLQFFRRTWSRLSAEQRLAQSQSTLPENAGPLHSHHLVHRSLTLMRDLSPAYFDHFIAYVDALLWIEQNPAQRPPAARKTSGNSRG